MYGIQKSVAPHSVCGQLADESVPDQLSDIFQIGIYHQAIEVALQADWFYQSVCMCIHTLETDRITSG